MIRLRSLCTNRRRTVLAISAAAVLSVLLLPTPSSSADLPASDSTSGASSAGPVPLTGEGSWDVDSELLGWQNDLYGSVSDPKINLNYVAQGGSTGLADLLNHTVDFAISGVPYTSDQLTGYSGGSSAIIAAPIMPSAVGFLLSPPPGGFYVENGQTGDASAPYTGPIRVPANELIAQMTNYSASPETLTATEEQDLPCEGGFVDTAVNYGEWDNPKIIENWDPSFLSEYNPSASECDIFQPFGQSPQPTYQAESNEDTYYAELWASQVATTMWGLLEQVSDKGEKTPPPWEPSGQVQPLIQKSMEFEPGLPESLTAFVAGYTPSGGAPTGGLVAPYPPSALTLADNLAVKLGQKARGVGQSFEWVEVPNANGDWVTPSPTSIAAALDATPVAPASATGGIQPLYAATNKVSGAYPLTYVDYLYAPATGLSVEKTEALATTIRYLVTDGQDSLAANNDAPLSSALVAQALSAANQLVQSNCPAADLTYTSALGPDTPGDLPGLDGLGKEYHCEVPATTTATTGNTTTTLPGTTGTGQGAGTSPALAFSSAPAQSTSLSSSGTTSLGSPSAAATSSGENKSGKSAEGSKSLKSKRSSEAEAQLASSLPFPIAASTRSSLDKGAALAMGVLLYLLFRKRPLDWIRKQIG